MFVPAGCAYLLKHFIWVPAVPIVVGLVLSVNSSENVFFAAMVIKNLGWERMLCSWHDFDFNRLLFSSLDRLLLSVADK